MLANKRNKYMHAFTIIELSLVIVITGTILLGVLKFTQNFKENEGYMKERVFNTTMRNGINNSFIDIIEAFSVSASTFTDGSSDWGWSLLPNTSPLPVSNVQGGLRHIVYNLDSGILSANELKSLHSKIESNFSGICTKINTAQPNGDIRLVCPKLSSISYSVGASLNLLRGHGTGTPLDPSLVPIVTVSYLREYTVNAKAATTERYQFNMEEVYLHRRNYSMRKMTTIKTAMENFHNRAIARELANSSSGGGLNSMDDIFVPWMWLMYGDDPTKINTLCNKTGASCTNISSDDIWRNTLSDKGLFVKRIIDNLLAGDYSFAVDGFNNPIFVYPFMSQCPAATLNISDCTVTSPSLPADNYIASGNPPYVSAIYTPSFGLKSVIAPDYGRMYLSF